MIPYFGSNRRSSSPIGPRPASSALLPSQESPKASAADVSKVFVPYTTCPKRRISAGRTAQRKAGPYSRGTSFGKHRASSPAPMSKIGKNRASVRRNSVHLSAAEAFCAIGSRCHGTKGKCDGVRRSRCADRNRVESKLRGWKPRSEQCLVKPLIDRSAQCSDICPGSEAKEFPGKFDVNVLR